LNNKILFSIFAILKDNLDYLKKVKKYLSNNIKKIKNGNLQEIIFILHKIQIIKLQEVEFTNFHLL